MYPTSMIPTCMSSYTIVVITPDGRKHGTLLSDKDGVNIHGLYPIGQETIL